LYVGGVPFGGDLAAAFECGGEFAGFCGLFGGQQGEPAHLLGPGQVLAGARPAVLGLPPGSGMPAS